MDKEEVAREKGIYRVTIVGSVVNFLLLLFKFFAGIMGHSAAMLADADIRYRTLLQTSLSLFLCVSLPSRKMRDTTTDMAIRDFGNCHYRYCIAFCRLRDFLERRFIYLSVSSRWFFAGTGNAGTDSGIGVRCL